MDYIVINKTINRGFIVSSQDILFAVNRLNDFLETLPINLYRSIDLKTMGSMIGALLCSYIADRVEGAMVNPIEKGYPDIIPDSGANASEEELRHYSTGLEVKGTVGNVISGTNGCGIRRIENLKSVVWQAHHQEVNNLLCFVWDFCNNKNGFNYPAITCVFYSDKLRKNDWGAVSGTTGRNTKVCAMLASGKNKVGEGLILIADSEEYIQKYKSIIDSIPVQ